MTRDQAITLYALIANFLWLQGNVCLIGNRQYSIHYKSHLIGMRPIYYGFNVSKLYFII